MKENWIKTIMELEILKEKLGLREPEIIEEMDED